MKSDPWEQLSNESAAAFGLFRAYLELGPDRSVEAVIENSETSEKAIRLAYKKYKWVSRARVYDNYLARAELNAAKRKLEQDAVKWVHRFTELRESEWSNAQQLIAKAKKMLAFPLTEETVVETAGPEITDFETGEKVPTKKITIIVKPVKFTLKDAALFVDTASKLMRLASGQETERKLLGVNVFGSADENLNAARDLYRQLLAEYADRPDVLELLPTWLADQWGLTPKQIEGVEEGDEAVTVDGEIVDESLSSPAEQ